MRVDGPVCFHDVEVDGHRVDVHCAEGFVTAITAPGVVAAEAVELIDGHGGALLPGLHDHHLHLLSMATSLTSVDCGPEAASDAAQLAARLAAGVGHRDGWVRGIGYHESVAGPLDRDWLDRHGPPAPVRIQHRSGALWVLNSLAVELLGPTLYDAVGSPRSGVECDERGRLTGRLWRADALLGDALEPRAPDLAGLGRLLRGLGITGVTDATPDLRPDTVELLARAVTDGSLPVQVTLLGAARPPAPLHLGPMKLLLPDHELPDFETLVGWIERARRDDRGVAVHCVTRESLVLTVVALEQVGVHRADRIEHGAVVPDELVPILRRLGLRVVTQPDFLRTRGDSYRRDVDPNDLGCLYPYASLIAGGVAAVASSDAPFGNLDPWQVIASAVERRTRSGYLLGDSQRVTARQALDGYLSPADDPGGPPRRISAGAPADVVLLGTPLAEALAHPLSVRIHASLVGTDLQRSHPG